MTTAQKKEALENSLISFQLTKYFIYQVNKGSATKFCLAEKQGTMHGLNTRTRFMTYEEFNAYLIGYRDAKENRI